MKQKIIGPDCFENSKQKELFEREYLEFLKTKVGNESCYYQQFLICQFKKGDRILDYGCGPGGLLKLLKLNFSSIHLYGCDTNKEIIKNNLKDPQIKDVDFSLVKSGQKTKFKNSFFNTIFLLDVIEHSQKPEDIIKEIRRIVKKNGKLILNTPDRLSIVLDPKFYGSIFNFFPFNIKRPLGKVYMEYTHKREFSYVEIKKILEKNGFKIINTNRKDFWSKIPWFYRGSIKIVAEKA